MRINPVELAYDSGKGEIFVADWGSYQVSVISDATNTVVATISTPAVGLAYDRGKGAIFVAMGSGGSVRVFSDSTNAFVADIRPPPGSWPSGVAYAEWLGEVFVTDNAANPPSAPNVIYGPNMVTVISDATNSVLSNLPVGQGPLGLAYDAGSGFLYVGNNAQGTISIISVGNASTPTAAGFFFLGAATAAIVASVAVFVLIRRRRRTPPPSS